MTFIDEIATYLQTNNFGTVGQSIFAGEFPEETDSGICILSVPSPEPDKSISVYRQSIDFWSRYQAGKSLEAEEKLNAIFQHFHKKRDFTIGTKHVYLSYALGLVDDMGRDSVEKRLYRLSLTFLYR
jgi:hypothetical protein